MTSATSIIEAEDTKRGRYRIRVLRAGVSKNGNFYPDTTLRDAVSMFEGTRVFAKSDAQHRAGGGKDIGNLIGGLSDVAFVEGDETDAGELRATLTLIDPDGSAAVKLREAWKSGMTGLFGFSIDATAETRNRRVDGRAVREARRFTKINSVDLIVEPSAGGEVLDLIESQKGDTMPTKTAEPKEFNDPDFLTKREIKLIVEATKLPRLAKDRLIEAQGGNDALTEDALRESIKAEGDYVAKLSESGAVRGLGDDDFEGRTHLQVIEGRNEKVVQMIDAFFDPADRTVTSIRECYLNITGDRQFSGLVRNCDQTLLRESIGSATFSDVLGDGIARRMIREYRNDSIYDVWKGLADIVPVGDFRTQERARFGGYGDLPIVAEGASYDPLTSPTDEKATYAVAKRGGTEDLTLEMITNDDVQAVRRIPQRLVTAAKRTLSKFVLDILKDNPVIYDGLALFHATHGNLGAAALDATSLAAGRLAMKAQTELDSGEKLGIAPRYLWVPDELEETAVDLFRRNTENDKNFIHTLSLNVMPVWYWTDPNDWCVTADPTEIPSVEVGFLGGQEEPQVFIQDLPTVGSMFTNDKVTYKIRHIYGAAVVDYRGTYKAVVA